MPEAHPQLCYYEQGLFLRPGPLALDAAGPAALGFISHAHADHFAPHGLIHCTRETAALLELRFGVRRFRILEYGAAVEIGGMRCTALPAGHMLGSAMLLVEAEGQRLLYTGDFRLRPSGTAAACQPVPADTLIMECTFGRPGYRFPPRERVAEQLVACVRQAFEFEQTPVIEAYAVGKAQQVAQLLADAGIPTLMDPAVYAASQIYEQFGCTLGNYQLYGPKLVPGCAVIRPPRGMGRAALVLPRRRREIAVTGWAIRHRRPGQGPEYQFPISDHADYDELIECVERVAPQQVYCLHGQREWVADLRARGWKAAWVGDAATDAPSGPQRYKGNQVT